ncbi:DsbE family thiol:disulfide interchange protein [Labrys neptuniae]|uniref:DsbE family thiol:disulfide interchange protein n=1 Tax=Labrys TaxID=204476 RepID=UPI000836CFC1|nr:MULTISPECIES: DsbE family thiol:disulfide interchange protein [Labrys]MDT3377253.1 DsbE family thiol:disulfide interchange protein [Labrys neptuniae]OCC01961.1 thiol:disulfide interchange protein [Labrys sp. WJW]
MSDSQTLPPAPRRRALVFLPLIVFAALAGLFFYQLRSGGDPSALPSTLIGKPVPQMSLPPLAELVRDGKALPGLATADLKSGGVSVVNIFASWCGPCRDEHPVLMKLAGLGKGRLVAINYKDDPDNARRYLGTFGNPYEAVGVDVNGRSAIDWGVYGVPETFVVNGKGEIVDKIVGPLSEDSLRTRLLPAIEAASKS